VGAGYTSVSFIKSWHPVILRYENWAIICFISISTIIFVSIGQPVRLLILAGALNGLILPLTLGTILVAAHQKKIIGQYRHPRWLTAFGLLVVILMAWMGGYTLINQLEKLFS
jgi:Mn2+/Fe2+ NRAMP family transporter